MLNVFINVGTKSYDAVTVRTRTEGDSTRDSTGKEKHLRRNCMEPMSLRVRFSLTVWPSSKYNDLTMLDSESVGEDKVDPAAC